MSARPNPPAVLGSLELGTDRSATVVRINTFDDGSVSVVLRGPEQIHASGRHTLGQAIQIRDFLNRHLDELALQQTGSLAVRSDDGTEQLAAVEEIRHFVEGVQTGTVRVDAPTGELHLVWNPSRTECVGFFAEHEALLAAHGDSSLAGCPTNTASAFRKSYAPDDQVLPQTTVTFYE